MARLSLPGTKVTTFEILFMRSERAQHMPSEVVVPVAFPIIAAEFEKRRSAVDDDQPRVRNFGDVRAVLSLLDVELERFEVGNEIVQPLGRVLALPPLDSSLCAG